MQLGMARVPASNSPASTAATGTAVRTLPGQNGGRFDFDDGGTYCGGWEDGKAHGHGVCTGPKGQGAYCGSWHFGFEVSGVYTWPSGSSYEGQWQNGKRHGLGIESRGRWIYRGEWTQGYKGRYGVRQSTTSSAKYEGTWANGLQDGYGSETYADSGTYQGQWLRGMRHGYGVRVSAPFGLASHYRPKAARSSQTSLRSNEATNIPAGVEAAVAAAERDRRVDDARGGFVLTARSDEPPPRRRSLVEKSLKKSILSGLRMRKQRSTGDLEKKMVSGGSIRSTTSSTSWMSTESSHSGGGVGNGGSLHTDSNASFIVEDEHMDANVTETYLGEWKNDKRSGFGISERTDGLRYEGEWFNNKKYGYGVTVHRDGSREEGKYKNNVLITSKKKHLFLIRSAKFRERIDAAVNAAQRASKIALQKADIAISRMATARGKAELSDSCAYQAREDFDKARNTAKLYAPEFSLPSLDRLQLRDLSKFKLTTEEKPPEPPPPEPTPPKPPNVPNPPLPPRGHTPHRQSLSNFQPRSLYAQREAPSPPPKPDANHYPAYRMPSVDHSKGRSRAEFVRSDAIRRPSVDLSPSEADDIPGQPYYTYYEGDEQITSNSSQYKPTVRPPDENRHGTENGQPVRYNSTATNTEPNDVAYRPMLRRNSKPIAGDGSYSFRQSMNDHYDHYERPRSRDNSVDRYTRTVTQLSHGSRQPSTERSRPPSTEPPPPTDRSRSSSIRPPTPVTGNGSATGAGFRRPSVRPAPFEEFIMRKRSLGQDIVPSPNGQPKRTESLYMPAAPVKNQNPKSSPTAAQIQRKKSMPDFQVLPNATAGMSREEVSYLSSARREEMRRLQEENERLRANPFLYLVSPHVKVQYLVSLCYVKVYFFVLTGIMSSPVILRLPHENITRRPSLGRTRMSLKDAETSGVVRSLILDDYDDYFGQRRYGQNIRVPILADLPDCVLPSTRLMTKTPSPPESPSPPPTVRQYACGLPKASLRYPSTAILSPPPPVTVGQSFEQWSSEYGIPELNYPAVKNSSAIVTASGIMSLMVHEFVRVDLTVDGSVRILNFISDTAVSVNSSGNCSAFLHPLGRVRQSDSKIDIVGYATNGNNKFAKMWSKGVSFASDRTSCVWLTDAAGTRSTADTFSNLLASDFSRHVFYYGAKYGTRQIESCVDILNSTYHKQKADGSIIWIINNILIQKTADNLFSINRGRNEVQIKTNLSGKGRLTTPTIHCTASLGEQQHLFVKSGEKRMHYDGLKFVVRNAAQSAGFDEHGEVTIY